MLGQWRHKIGCLWLIAGGPRVHWGVRPLIPYKPPRLFQASLIYLHGIFLPIQWFQSFHWRPREPLLPFQRILLLAKMDDFCHVDTPKAAFHAVSASHLIEVNVDRLAECRLRSNESLLLAMLSTCWNVNLPATPHTIAPAYALQKFSNTPARDGRWRA